MRSEQMPGGTEGNHADTGRGFKNRTYDSTKTDDANQRWNVDLVNQPTGQIIMSEAAYVQNGNYVDKITDSLGNVEDYYNEPINGLLRNNRGRA